MSGTSLDGLDMALCSFEFVKGIWKYELHAATTIDYPSELRKMLEDAINLNAAGLIELDHYYGRWIGKEINKYLTGTIPKPDFISSHGHTVFHQPAKGFTLQIGNGNDIFAVSGIPVIYDFRSLDVALGGQGAPLVPVGDELLFSHYEVCVNLGGFSNLSYRKENRRIAWDICPVNICLNQLALQKGHNFDYKGEMGRQGRILPGLLESLNKLEYYRSNPPKSLGKEWYIKYFEPFISGNESFPDKLRTCYEHIAIQIASAINISKGKTVLYTGGGAKNDFLLELLSSKTGLEIKLPDPMLVDYKEAIVFAFLGYLRCNNIHNVLSSVTGSSGDHCAGSMLGI